MVIKNGSLSKKQQIAFELHMACAKYKFHNNDNPILLISEKCKVSEMTVRNWLAAKTDISLNNYILIKDLLKDYFI